VGFSPRGICFADFFSNLLEFQGGFDMSRARRLLAPENFKTIALEGAYLQVRHKPTTYDIVIPNRLQPVRDLLLIAWRK
jgi:hypothetical protein